MLVNLEKMNKLDYRSNEAYKLLRTNIQFCGSDIKVICITSCLPNEGKSSVSFNLAVAFAESGKKIVFIDADLRRSVLVGRYQPDHAVLGLTHYLSGQSGLDEILYNTNIPFLDMIFTGPVSPNPAELLGGTIFCDLVELLRNEYDYVIIDTPPLSNVVDGAIISEPCDGLVLVIEANAVSYKLAQRVIKQLEKGKCRILGAVLNKAEAKNGQYSYYGNRYKKYKKYDKKYYAVS
jgi:capsular exopolysaccharide synthesis family protein